MPIFLETQIGDLTLCTYLEGPSYGPSNSTFILFIESELGESSCVRQPGRKEGENEGTRHVGVKLEVVVASLYVRSLHLSAGSSEEVYWKRRYGKSISHHLKLIGTPRQQ
eukprot:scaffold15305_cov126-Cylindrotheca_fusiformis.AAC.11